MEREEFANVLEAQVLARAWRHEYDHVRPHSAMGYQTPAAFAKTCARPQRQAGRAKTINNG